MHRRHRILFLVAAFVLPTAANSCASRTYDFDSDGVADATADSSDDPDTSTDGLECCGPQDACGLADNGICDCAGEYPWDTNDCTSTDGTDYDGYDWDGYDYDGYDYDGYDYDGYDYDGYDYDGYDYDGYDGWDCCQTEDVCGWAMDGVCDCNNEMPWDKYDCEGSTDGPSTTDGFDTGTDDGMFCCGPVDECGLAENGICDCGPVPWDEVDCGTPPPDDCASCLDVACPAELDACFENSDCVCIIECVFQGGDRFACFGQCNATITPELDALNTCAQGSCPVCYG